MGRYSRAQKKMLSFILLVTAVSVIVGELGIFYVYSWYWYWPDIGPAKGILSRMKQHKPVGEGRAIPTTGPYRYHYENGVVHYYTSPSENPRYQKPSIWLKILVLSDPHIMCTYNKEEPLISRWDNDRYLALGYSRLLGRLAVPDVVVFLGDLFSDGFRASTEQWSDYMRCFDAIFPSPSEKVTRLFVVGDNDIGGEGPDLMTEETLRHARTAFGNLNSVVTEKGVMLAKLTTSCFINHVPRTKAENDCKIELADFINSLEATRSMQKNSQPSQNASVLPRIAFSHVPELPLGSSMLWTSVKLQEKFDYVVSGHIHHQRYSSRPIWGSSWKKPTLTSITHEITVPTCSYRMGEVYPGAGALVVGSNGDISYRVLWLPPRYPFFVLYVIELVLILLTTFKLCRCRTLQ